MLELRAVLLQEGTYLFSARSWEQTIKGKLLCLSFYSQQVWGFRKCLSGTFGKLVRHDCIFSVVKIFFLSERALMLSQNAYVFSLFKNNSPHTSYSVDLIYLQAFFGIIYRCTIPPRTRMCVFLLYHYICWHTRSAL